MINMVILPWWENMLFKNVIASVFSTICFICCNMYALKQATIFDFHWSLVKKFCFIEFLNAFYSSIFETVISVYQIFGRLSFKEWKNVLEKKLRIFSIKKISLHFCYSSTGYFWFKIKSYTKIGKPTCILKNMLF